MPVEILGIRHHGPGSAKSVIAALKKMKPELILVEGPPDSDAILSFVSDKKMKPPVALLAYMPEEPVNALFYPFAEFSPEWQSVLYANKNKVPIKFMDLPLKHRFALEKEKSNPGEDVENQLPEEPEVKERKDPFLYLAEISGFQDGEMWWEYMFEQKENPVEIFKVLLDAMRALREIPGNEDKLGELREAYMREIIRDSEKSFKKIAVVCGAWHAPALEDGLKTKEKDDNSKLKKLPSVKNIESTWIPWTFDRLTFKSGYGAGVQSPGWYHHLWKYKNNITSYWMAKVARSFRKENMDVSVAHIIESVRLVEALCTLRNLSRPGLTELNEAVQSVVCFGDSIPLKLVEKELIIGKKMGQVPDNTPKVPLQHDLEKLQKKLRMKQEPEVKIIDLDLRQNSGIEKSKLLHRLNLLGIHWGKEKSASSTGTFKESWALKWEPELMIKTIDMAPWGNTVEDACSNYVIHSSDTDSLSRVSELVYKSIPADIPKATPVLVKKIDDLASVCGDILELMDALENLTYVTRYGNVRKTEFGVVESIVDRLVIRISLGLPGACFATNEDLAESMVVKIEAVDRAIALLEKEEHKKIWLEAIQSILDTDSIHGLILGKCSRLLFKSEIINNEDLENQFSLALSNGNEPSFTASWLEGFLKGGGIRIVEDKNIWNLLDSWVANLSREEFSKSLPLLRRAFSAFEDSDKDRIARQASGKGFSILTDTFTGEFNEEQASGSLPIIRKLLGLPE